MTQQKPQSENKTVTARDLHSSFTEPPYSQEAEAALLGAVLVNPEIFGRISDFLNADDFYILRHKYIWEAFGRLLKRTDAIDLLTTSEELHNMGWLNEIGEAYLTHLVNVTPTSMHAEFYGKIVLRASVRRRLMQAADEIKAMAMDEQMELSNIILLSVEKLDTVATAARTQQQHLVHVEDTIQVQWARLDDLISGTATVPSRIPTGLKDYDDILGGGVRAQEIRHYRGAPSYG